MPSNVRGRHSQGYLRSDESRERRESRSRVSSSSASKTLSVNASNSFGVTETLKCFNSLWKACGRVSFGAGLCRNIPFFGPPDQRSWIILFRSERKSLSMTLRQFSKLSNHLLSGDMVKPYVFIISILSLSSMLPSTVWPDGYASFSMTPRNLESESSSHPHSITKYPSFCATSSTELPKEIFLATLLRF